MSAEISIGDVKVFTHYGSIEAGAEAINLHAAEAAIKYDSLVVPHGVQYLTDLGKTVMWYEHRKIDI